MNVAHLTAHLSKKSGGVIEVIEALHSEYSKDDSTTSYIAGIQDNTVQDKKLLTNTSNLFACKEYGPHSFGYAPELVKTLNHIQPDIVHTHGLWMYNSYVSLKHHLKLKTPYIITSHGMLDKWALTQAGLKKKLVLNLFEKQHLEMCSCLHALNESEYQSIRKTGLKNPIAVIPNGIYHKHPILSKNTTDWQNINKKKQLLFFGRLTPKKGLQELLEAWAIIIKTRNDWTLKIAGWSEDQFGRKLQEQSEKLQLGNSVEFCGALFGDAKEKAYLEADAFILPSLSEGLPMTVLEAWSYSLPVLMTRECNLSEAFDQKAAIEIHHSHIQLSKELLNFFQFNPSKIDTLAKNGYQLSQQKYSWTFVAEQFHKLYHSIVYQLPFPEFVRED